jgi:hypothetical protein
MKGESMKLTVSTHTNIKIEKDQEGYVLFFEGGEHKTQNSFDPKTRSFFGPEIMRTGSISDLALNLSHEASKDIEPCVLSALERIAIRNTGQLAIITENNEKETDYRFFLGGSGLPLSSYNPAEERLILIEARAKMVALFNEEAERLGFPKMVLGERVSSVSGTDLHLVMSGVLGGYTKGHRSYGALTSRCSIYQASDLLLVSASTAEAEKLQFTQEQAASLSLLLGRDPQAIEESNYGWTVSAKAE